MHTPWHFRTERSSPPPALAVPWLSHRASGWHVPTKQLGGVRGTLTPSSQTPRASAAGRGAPRGGLVIGSEGGIAALPWDWSRRDCPRMPGCPQGGDVTPPQHLLGLSEPLFCRCPGLGGCTCTHTLLPPCGAPCTPWTPHPAGCRCPAEAPPCKPGQHGEGQESGAGAAGGCSPRPPAAREPRAPHTAAGEVQAAVKHPRDTARRFPAARSRVSATCSASNLLAKLDDFIVIFLIDLPAIIESYTIHTQPVAGSPASNPASPSVPPGQALPPWLCPDSNL